MTASDVMFHWHDGVFDLTNRGFVTALLLISVIGFWWRRDK